MPAAYAHHVFGEACLDTMPERYKQICLKYRELYDIGVHGPDILFYYHPLGSNEVNQYGHRMHIQTGTEVFKRFKAVWKGESGQLRKSDRGAFMAYMLGFLAHFTLDSSAHAYINEMDAAYEPSHNMIESQYEAYLIRRDGKDAISVDRSLTLKPSGRNARVISQIFPFSQDEILTCMKSQKDTLHLFYSPLEVKKKMIRGLIDLLKISGDFGDLFLDPDSMTICQPMMEEISKRQEKALNLYPVLFNNLILYLKDEETLDHYYQHDFEGLLQ